MGVALLNPIVSGTYVQVQCKDYALSGMARVKHCSREKSGYKAGLEFSGFQWRVPVDTPLEMVSYPAGSRRTA